MVPHAADVPIFNKSSVYAPNGYFISNYHTWAYPEDKSVKVGIDNFAVKALGKIFVKDIVKPGMPVKKGDTIIKAEVHGKQINFKSPVSGTIKAVNNLLFNNTVKDAFGKDWGLQIEKKDNIESLMSGSSAQQWLKKEMRRLKDFLAESSFAPEAVGVTMYDGGNIIEGVLSSLNTDVIPDFEEQFLSGNNE
jgi:glycine cleavage system H lipoate-binding protein